MFFSGLSPGEMNCLERFYYGASPKKLLNHPVFWTVDRRKCFVLDLANSRTDLKIAMTHQTKFIEKSGKTFSTEYSRFDLMDLVIFTSNIIRHFREIQKENNFEDSKEDKLCFHLFVSIIDSNSSYSDVASYF